MVDYKGVLVAQGRTQPEIARLQQEAAKVINSLLLGKTNNVTSVTLTANSATTTITDTRITFASFIGLTPATANAATATANVYVSARGDGTATLTHANNAQADRTFIMLIVG